MDDPNYTEGGLRYFVRTLVRSLASSLGRLVAVALIACSALALVGGLVALCYFGWSAVPLGFGLGAATGVLLTAAVFGCWPEGD